VLVLPLLLSKNVMPCCPTPISPPACRWMCWSVGIGLKNVNYKVETYKQNTCSENGAAQYSENRPVHEKVPTKHGNGFVIALRSGGRDARRE